MKTAQFPKLIIFLAIVLVAFLCLPQKSLAKLSDCSATIDTHQVDINTSSEVILEVTNLDDNNGRMLWIKITSPSDNLTIQDHGSSETFTGFDAGVNSPVDERIVVIAGGNAEASKDWIVKASDDPNGADPNTTICGGDLGMQVIDPANYNPPRLSDITVSNVTDTSVTLSFTTNRDATCELDYGKSGQPQDQKQNESSPTSSHSFSLSGLSANTTYNFTIKAVNDNGENDGSGSFVTAANAYATPTPQIIHTTTTTTTVLTPTPTPTPPPDLTPPSIYVSTDFAKPFLQSPQISGTATDNKAVSKVEYSLDGGHNWLVVDSAPNLGKASTAFGFLPPPLDDGNYALQVRGTDSSNNIGTSKIYTLVIDRLPPQASGVLFSLGPQIINPKIDGTVVTLAGQSLKITLSEVGGSTGAAVLAKSTTGSSKTFNLTKNSDNGLWSGTFSLSEGEYQLAFKAIDGAGNNTTRDLNKILALSRGNISEAAGSVANTRITVYYQEPVTNSWQIWDGAAYSQTNPQSTDKSGNYNLFLPPGRYYLHIEAFGYKATDTEFFNVTTPTPINANFKLSPLKLLFALGPLKIYLPDFSVLSVPLKNNLSEVSHVQNSFEGKATPFFSLSVANQNSLNSDSLMGKPSVLTFLNTWSPASTEQISILNEFSKNKDFNSAVIVEGEKVSKVYVFQKRGGYALPIYADPDATLTLPYNLSFLPVHYFLDRKGIVKKVIYGALNENELANTLINISQ